MKLLRHAQLAAEEQELVEIRVGYSEAQVLLNATREYFTVRDAGNLILAGGAISHTMLSDFCYLWVVLVSGQYTFRQRRAGIACAREFILSLPERVFAEVALGDRTSAKFIETLGFIRRKVYDDRTLYEWVN